MIELTWYIQYNSLEHMRALQSSALNIVGFVSAIKEGLVEGGSSGLSFLFDYIYNGCLNTCWYYIYEIVGILS